MTMIELNALFCQGQNEAGQNEFTPRVSPIWVNTAHIVSISQFNCNYKDFDCDIFIGEGVDDFQIDWDVITVTLSTGEHILVRVEIERDENGNIIRDVDDAIASLAEACND